MYFKKITTINWGTLRPGMFDFAPTTLLTGVSGSGKSMLLDAVMAVATGTHAKACRFNLAQSENDKRKSTKEYRTLEGYALGQIDQSFSRTSAHCWLALVVAPSATEIADPFTAVLGATAGLDGGKPSLDRLQLYLIRGEASEEHFVLKSKTGVRSALPLLDARDHLEKIFGTAHIKAFGDAKGDYIQSFYGWVEGKPNVSPTEALTSAKAFAKTIAFRPVDNVHELVRDEIVEEVDMGPAVNETSAIMRNVRALRIEGDRLRASLKALHKIEDAGQATRARFVALTITELAQAQYRVLANQRTLRNAETESAAFTEDIQRLQRDLDARKDAKEDVQKRLRAVESRLAELPAAGQESQLKKDIAQAENIEQTNIAALAAAIRQLAGRPEHSAQLFALLAQEPLVARELARAREAAEAFEPSMLARLSGDFARRLESGRDVSDFKRLVEQLDAADRAFIARLREGEDALVTAVDMARGELRAKSTQLATDMAALRRRLAALSAGSFDAPESVHNAVEIIRVEVPGSNPRMLAELVEPKTGSAWIGAIEAYIGANRYAIIVEPVHERAAMECLKGRNFGRGPKPRIPQIARLLEETKGMSPAADSILEELEVRNPIARAYLLANYGKVLKVHDIDALRRVNRGLMLDGRSAGGYAVSAGGTEPEGGLAFGVASREAKMARVQQDLLGLETEGKALTARMQVCAAVVGALRGVSPVRVVDTYRLLLEARERIASATAALALLDLADVRNLRELETEIQAQQRQLEQQDRADQEALGEKRTLLKAAQGRIAEAKRNAPDREQRLEDQLAIVSAHAATDPTLDLTALRAKAQEEAEKATREETLGSRLSPERDRFMDAFRELRTVLSEYNSHCRPQELIENKLTELGSSPEPKSVFNVLGGILRRTADQLRIQESHALAENADRLQKSETEFNSVFTASFAYKMLNNIEDGVKPLRMLNIRIRKLVFGRDTYEVVYKWVPEYEEYWQFFKTIRDRSDELEGGRTIFDLELSPSLARVRDELRNLLLSDNANAADKRLEEITDWRDYRTYDIKKTRTDNGATVLLSTWGTGSGGEAQTPFYVVRAAVLSAALRHGNESDSHLHTLMFDEAFSNMDGPRSRAVIGFLRDTFGFQVTVAMPTLNSGKVRTLFDREFSFAMVKASGAGTAGVVTNHCQIDLKPAAIESLYQRSLHAIESAARAEHAAARGDGASVPANEELRRIRERRA